MIVEEEEEVHMAVDMAEVAVEVRSIGMRMGLRGGGELGDLPRWHESMTTNDYDP